MLSNPKCYFQIIKQQSDKINEMITIMQKAVSFDEGDLNRERERFNKLTVENKVRSKYLKNVSPHFNILPLNLI